MATGPSGYKEKGKLERKFIAYAYGITESFLKVPGFPFKGLWVREMTQACKLGEKPSISIITTQIRSLLTRQKYFGYTDQVEISRLFIYFHLRDLKKISHYQTSL